MSAAARQLYMSQSSVSQAITEIEREYGVVLFDRVGRQLHITPLGRELLDHARRAVAYQDSIEAWLGQSAKRKRLRVGVSMTVGATVLSGILARLRQCAPEVEATAFVGNTDTVLEKLLGSEIDVALVEGQIKNAHIDSRVVMEDRLVLICGREHRFFGREEVSIRELEGETLLFREHGSGTRAQLVEQLEKYGIGYREGWESCSSEAIRKGVVDGHGLAVISERLVREDRKGGRLWACVVRELPACRYFSLATYQNRVETEAMRMFAQVVEECAREEDV